MSNGKHPTSHFQPARPASGSVAGRPQNPHLPAGRQVSHLSPPTSTKGFTFIEFLIIMSIVVLLGLTSVPFLSRFYTQNAVSNTYDQLVAELRKAQTYAMIGKQNGPWGVYYDTSGAKIILYQGTSYASRNPMFDEKFTINPNITISGLAEINFAQVTGTASATPALNLVSNSDFENDPAANGSTPAGWNWYNSAGTQTYKGVANDFAAYGNNSYKISTSVASDSGIYQQISGIILGVPVTLSVFVKTDALVTNASVVLDTWQFGAGGSKTQIVNVGANNNGRVTVSFTPDSTKLNIFLGLGSFGVQSTGTVWYDGVQLEYGSTASDYKTVANISIAGNNTKKTITINNQGIINYALLTPTSTPIPTPTNTPIPTSTPTPIPTPTPTPSYVCANSSNSLCTYSNSTCSSSNQNQICYCYCSSGINKKYQCVLSGSWQWQWVTDTTTLFCSSSYHCSSSTCP